MDATPLGKIAVRFPRLAADRLRINAQDTYDWDVRNQRVPPRLGVSVRADVPHAGETAEDVVVRLCTTAPLRGEVVAVITNEELEHEGFVLVPDPDPEDPLHHLIGSGNLLEMPDTVRLAALLATHKRTRPQLPTEGTS